MAGEPLAGKLPGLVGLETGVGVESSKDVLPPVLSMVLSKSIMISWLSLPDAFDVLLACLLPKMFCTSKSTLVSDIMLIAERGRPSSSSRRIKMLWIFGTWGEAGMEFESLVAVVMIVLMLSDGGGRFFRSPRKLLT